MGLWNAIANRFGYVKRDVDPYALIPRSAKTATISDAPAWLQAEGEEEGYNIPDRMLPRAQLELYQRLSWLQIAVNHVATTAAGTGAANPNLIITATAGRATVAATGPTCILGAVCKAAQDTPSSGYTQVQIDRPFVPGYTITQP